MSEFFFSLSFRKCDCAGLISKLEISQRLANVCSFSHRHIHTHTYTSKGKPHKSQSPLMHWCI